MIKPLDRTLILNAAEKILKEFGLCTLPVDLSSLLRIKDIMLFPKDSFTDGVSGMLIRVDGDYSIAYSTCYRNPGFERFSIAHEIGHYFLEGHPYYDVDGQHISNAGFISQDQYEKEADIFASGLLMPEDLFKDHMGNYPIGLEGIIGMAELCQTSLTATAIRYVGLTTKKIMVILSTDGVINFCAVSDKIFLIKDKEIPKKECPIPKNTATAKLSMDKVRVTNRERDSIDADLSDWLELDRSKKATEEVIGLGRYGKVLTVICA